MGTLNNPTMSVKQMQSPEFSTSDIRQGIRTGLRKTVLWSLGIMVFIILLVFNISAENWQLSLNAIDWMKLFTGWLFMLSTMWVLGLRWKSLLPHSTASRGFFAAGLSGGLLINYALPGPMGEIMGGWLLKREDGTPILEGLTASTIARLLGLLVAACGAVALWFFVDITDPRALVLLQVLLIGIGCGGILLILLHIYAEPFANWTRTKAEGHPIRTIGQAFEMTHTLSFFGLLWATLHSIVGHLLAGLGVWISLSAMGATPDFIDIFFVYLVGTCCGTVAFLFPGSQFTWDAIFMGLLISVANYSMPDAALVTGILRLEQLAMMLFGAGPLFWILWRQGTHSMEK